MDLYIKEVFKVLTSINAIRWINGYQIKRKKNLKNIFECVRACVCVSVVGVIMDMVAQWRYNQWRALMCSHHAQPTLSSTPIL